MLRSSRVIGLAVVVSFLASAAALPTANTATAQPRAATWILGDCYATALVSRDLVDLRSHVSCADTHRAQIVGGSDLPASLSGYTYAQLTDQSNKELRTQLNDLSDTVCSGRAIAPAIWRQQGTSVARVLKPPAATEPGGALPGMLGLGHGWVFPDEASFNAGDRSLICVIYRPLGRIGHPGERSGELKGDVRQLATTRTLPAMRACRNLHKDGNTYSMVSCARPHSQEIMAFVLQRMPASYNQMSNAQWAPIDRQCRAVTSVLIGADRKGLRTYADTGDSAKKGDTVYLGCFVELTELADDVAAKLPPGTLVGHGLRPLSAH